MDHIIDQVYKLRRNFVVIGLTGRIGSGCSMLANWMRWDNKKFVETINLISDNNEIYNNEYRKYLITKKYLEVNWIPFEVITVSNVILFYSLLQNDFVEFETACICAISEKKGEEESDLKTELEKLRTDFENLHGDAKKCLDILYKNPIEGDDKSLSFVYDFLMDRMSTFCQHMREVLSMHYIPIMQTWENNIRRFDSVLLSKDSEAEGAPACLARTIKKIVKVIQQIKKKQKKPTFIVIDSLRNPYDILYFRERYSTFYMMSMNTTEEVRHQTLAKNGYHVEQIKKIDFNEGEKHALEQRFLEQDIDKCLELTDIHLAWENSIVCERQTLEAPYEKDVLTEGEVDLLKQLMTYISLIMHPGLISPSPYERSMQLAYTAKLNSGCLSRQVGAVVTNSDFSVRSIGWNTVPKGQTPCTLRCLDDLCQKNDSIAFSEYETSQYFIGKATNLFEQYKKKNLEKLCGLRLAYCFKDIHISSEEKQSHNQVHTRSLHAEENAFLQLVRYGAPGIEGGFLFTTASCCELCAKKAYQLGIKKIYYIDSYPGISDKHILSCGTYDTRPKMELFRGAVGRAYVSLYNPYIPFKDEIAIRMDVEVKKEMEKIY